MAQTATHAEDDCAAEDEDAGGDEDDEDADADGDDDDNDAPQLKTLSAKKNE